MSFTERFLELAKDGQTCQSKNDEEPGVSSDSSLDVDSVDSTTGRVIHGISAVWTKKTLSWKTSFNPEPYLERIKYQLVRPRLREDKKETFYLIFSQSLFWSTFPFHYAP